MFMFRVAALVVTLGVMPCGDVLAQTRDAQAGSAGYEPSMGQVGKDVAWMPTSQILINRMLAMAEVTEDDSLVDLGSGDGRMVITAARQGVRAHGVEYNPDLVALSRRAAAAKGVSERATFRQADIFATDFSDASVVALFLSPELNLRLRPTLLAMKPGTRIVSNTYAMDDWEPDETARASTGCGRFCTAMKWIVPARVAGDWRLNGDELRLTQRFQKLEGTLAQGGRPVPISDAKVTGLRIDFTVGGRRYHGSIDAETMSGGVEGGEAWRAIRDGS